MCGESRTHGVERGERAEIISKPYLSLYEVSFELKDNGELMISVGEGDDVLTIRKFDPERYTFEFANEVSGTFNVETGAFEKTLTEEELAALEAAKTEDQEDYSDITSEEQSAVFVEDNIQSEISVSKSFVKSDDTMLSENIERPSGSVEMDGVMEQIAV